MKLTVMTMSDERILEVEVAVDELVRTLVR